MVFALPIFIYQWTYFKKVIVAFIISGVFVYLGSFYYLFNWIFKREYVTVIPFWYKFSHSGHATSYLENVSGFIGFPRFRLPFSSPAGTGVF